MKNALFLFVFLCFGFIKVNAQNNCDHSISKDERSKESITKTGFPVSRFCYDDNVYTVYRRNGKVYLNSNTKETELKLKLSDKNLSYSVAFDAEAKELCINYQEVKDQKVYPDGEVLAQDRLPINDLIRKLN